MSTHQYDENMRPDNEFIKGDLSFLVEGNRCRLLDGRRTTGYIEKYFPQSAMFRWRITKYEDQGRYWDLPVERITRFQFEKSARTLSEKRVNQIKEKINKFNQLMTIQADHKERKDTLKKIKVKKLKIRNWLKDNSSFFNTDSKLNFNSRKGSDLLAADLKKYMKSVNLNQIEEKTADIIVLNPSSGEWMKGMKIVLAEMGLVSYEGKVIRTEDIFTKLGIKKERCRYFINRLAFNQAYFSLLDINEVVLYRGMSTERGWIVKPRSFLSCTFNLDVARDFSSLERDSKYKNSYIVKMTLPVENIFMTYLETEAFNRQYQEAEALVLYNRKITI